VSQSKIKIASSWTRPGGGTVAHINLTNLLNENGYDCTFYGPHDWHLDKCKSDTIDKCVLAPDDILISHFIQIPPEAKLKKHILYCHEKDVYPLKKVSLAGYDLIVYVSNSQMEWQGVNYPSAIIPPLVDKFNWSPPKEKVAGVIGSVDYNKQVHKSINRALNNGYEKVLLFGQVNDTPYYNEYVSRYVDSGQVVLAGHLDDREAMYGQVSEVFHSSLSETYGLVEAECRRSGIPFNGESNRQEILDESEILNRWRNIL
jgi:hypothetical protein